MERTTGPPAIGDVEHVAAAVGTLRPRDVAAMSPEELESWAVQLERLRRATEAAAAHLTARIDSGRMFASEGFFSASAWARHRLQLSRPEAHRRCQLGRFLTWCSPWADAFAAGTVGIAQSELMARVAALDRVPSEVLVRDVGMLLEDAQLLGFADFERRLRVWLALAAPRADRAQADGHRAARSLRLRPRPDGGWTLNGCFDEATGSEVAEVLAHFADAEWRTDWYEAGSASDVDDGARLCRTDGQRWADALLAMARAASSAAPGLRGRPTVNVVIDSVTFEHALAGREPDPRTYRDVTCRTERGRRLCREDAVNLAITGHVRRVVIDSSSTVIDLGRRSRLFRGAARDAITLLEPECVWVGCDLPSRWCDGDHLIAAAARGPTSSSNGAPLCRRHNLLKERGHQVRKRSDGDWEVFAPDGSRIT